MYLHEYPPDGAFMFCVHGPHHLGLLWGTIRISSIRKMRMGKLAGASPDKTAKTSRILRLRNTLQNLAQVLTLYFPLLSMCVSRAA